jgi:hypothetical protein
MLPFLVELTAAEKAQASNVVRRPKIYKSKLYALGPNIADHILLSTESGVIL